MSRRWGIDCWYPQLPTTTQRTWAYKLSELNIAHLFDYNRNIQLEKSIWAWWKAVVWRSKLFFCCAASPKPQIWDTLIDESFLLSESSAFSQEFHCEALHELPLSWRRLHRRRPKRNKHKMCVRAKLQWVWEKPQCVLARPKWEKRVKSTPTLNESVKHPIPY